MSKFTNQLVLREITGSNEWVVEEDLVYELGYLGSGRTIKVPKGFPVDGASIPRFAWSIVGHPLYRDYRKSAVVHDFIYATHIYDRKKADEIFIEAMEVEGCWFWKRNTMWFCVRQFGAGAYNKDFEKINMYREIAGLPLLTPTFA